MDWFLYDRDRRRGKVNRSPANLFVSRNVAGGKGKIIQSKIIYKFREALKPGKMIKHLV